MTGADIMDQYFDENDIIAYTDTDAAFTIPVVDKSIIDADGKLVVKGYNMFNPKRRPGHIGAWDDQTRFSIGLPMVADFMTFFPTYFFVRTIRNCRNYIMKRHNVSNFEEFFLKYTKMISPVNIVFSYAFYFERDSYSWHIDTWPESLADYNKRLPIDKPVREIDTIPEIHQTVHAKYYKGVDTFERSICYLQTYLGMKNLKYCPLNEYGNAPIHLSYEFETANRVNHHGSWMVEKANETKEIVLDRYRIIGQLYQKKRLLFDTERIKMVEEFASNTVGVKCLRTNYEPFQRV